MSPLESLLGVLQEINEVPEHVVRGGAIVSVSSDSIGVQGINDLVSLGDVVVVGGKIRGEVVHLDRDVARVSLFHKDHSLRIGDPVMPDQGNIKRPTLDWLGRAVNALGEPIDHKGPLAVGDNSIDASKSDSRGNVLDRAPVEEPLQTGIRLLDIFTPICKGQRMGIFAGSGVGKSTLLSMLARADAFDAVVVSLVGERGREVREFLDESIGEDTMAKTVAVIATSDESPILRRRAPELAFDVCEMLSASGKNVLLLLDSLTRYAHALREIGIANGEPPVARGYPSSVFSALPKLLERAGTAGPGAGSITALTTVLVDGDDHNDPISDAVRGIIDGHLVLDRAIAEEGRYPPINPLSSVSRLSSKAWSVEERDLVLQLKKLISTFEETKDLRLLGGWKPGVDPQLDKAVETVPAIYDAIAQTPDAPPSENAFGELVSFLKGEQTTSKNERGGDNGQV